MNQDKHDVDDAMQEIKEHLANELSKLIYENNKKQSPTK